MAKANPKLQATKPKNIFTKPLTFDFKELFKAISKGIGHATFGKWEELGTDAVETFSAIGLTTQPEDLAFLLIRRSLTKALFDLVGESASQQLADARNDVPALAKEFDFTIGSKDVNIDQRFLDRPSELPVIADVQRLLQEWLDLVGVGEPARNAIASRLPTYFVFALNQEWRKNAASYRPLLDALNTPFAKAGDREWAWTAYSAHLQRRTDEGIFGEPFSLRQIYVPLNAFYVADPSSKGSADDLGRPGRQRRLFVVELQQELESWLDNPSKKDAIRVISGGPGSGKSSFAKIFAARVSQKNTPRVLFVPLHLIDPTKVLVDELGRFVRDEGFLLENPLDPNSPEPSLLVIFDGLDELASQGKAAADTAGAFVREVEKTVSRRNLSSVRLRVLISGRELVVQENESEFRNPRQILNLLPYFIPHPSEQQKRFIHDGDEYDDPSGLLNTDLRQEWWKKYGSLKGKGYGGLPVELCREDLREVTAQPLLNYLVALSYTRDKIDFGNDINLVHPAEARPG